MLSSCCCHVVIVAVLVSIVVGCRLASVDEIYGCSAVVGSVKAELIAVVVAARREMYLSIRCR